MSSFYFIFFVETKWDSVAFHVFCFVLFLFSFLSFAWGRNDDIQKGCAQVCPRAPLAQSERVWPSACTSLLCSAANTCTKLGMK